MFENNIVLIVVITALSIPILVLYITRPVIGCLVMLTFGLINPSLLPPIVEFGDFSIRYADFAVLLVTSVIFLQMGLGRKWLVSRDAILIFRTILLFVIYISMSLLWVWYLTPPVLPSSTASLARLFVTVLMGVLVYITIINKNQFMEFNHGLVLLMVVSVILGFQEPLQEIRVRRVEGILGCNTYGLVSGLLTVYGFAARRSKGAIKAILYIFIGLVGLVLSKSIASIFATSGALFFLVVHEIGVKKGVKIFFKHPKVILVGISFVIVCGLLVVSLRRADIEGLIQLSEGSLSQRLMHTMAGIKIFLHYPLLGVGWQTSGTEYYVGSLEFKLKLMSIFKNLPDHYYITTSIHNMYIQILAELGIVGFGLLLWVLMRVSKLIKIALALTRQSSSLEYLARFYAATLFFLLLWWNSNPLFGGQTESILAVVFIALLCKVLELSRHSSVSK